MSVVSNASPLIASEHVGLAHVFERLFGVVMIPPAVRQEVFAARALPSWITERALTEPLAAQLLQGRLGAGESAAIVLALEQKAPLLLMDELAGRRAAASLGLQVMGTLGILIRAKSHNLIPAIKPLIEQLISTGFYVDNDLAQRVLRTAGEASE